MADADVSQAGGLAASLPQFVLEPILAGGDTCWFRGRPTGGGQSRLVRRIDGIAFAVAVRDLAALVELFDTCPAGVAAPLAIVVTRQGRTVAGSATATSGLEITVDPAVAEPVADDAAVDVWAIYRDEGLEALADAATDPDSAVERLAAVAVVIDRLATGHGSIDSPALRSGPAGPLVLAVGLSSLMEARRERLDAVGPWLTIAPELCRQPGQATGPADQYALAALWANARTGRPLHVGDTAEALVRSKLSQPPGLDGLAAAERDVVARALAAAAEQRFESCTAFVAALRRVVVADESLAAARGPVALDLQRPHDSPPQSPTTADTRPGSVDVTAPLPSTEPAWAREANDRLGNGPQEQLVIPPDTRPFPDVATTIDPSTTSLALRLAAAPYKTGDLILPGYRLERRLGRGGFGEVWKAAAPGGMSVAIKVIGSLGRREGVREFRALRTVKDVRHAHIVPIFGVWLKTADGRLLEEDEASLAGDRILQGRPTGERGTIATRSGTAFDSLELVVAMGLGDQTLYDALQDCDPDAPPGIEPERLLGWMRQAALAIDHFNRGSVRDGATTDAVQHCDIKPQNMLLVGNAVQVCDFGLARVQGQARATANNLMSIAYAPPEMMVRPYNPSPTTDQYSLAVSYYELRTGRLPYGDQPESSSEEISAVELMRAKTDGKVELGLVSPLEQRVLLRALSLEPADRFGSCEELVDGLESAVEMDRTPQQQPTHLPGLTLFGLASGGVLATALLAWVLLRASLEQRTAKLQFVQAERVISAVIAAAEPEPAALDAAVASFHGVSATLPPTTKQRLQEGLARRIVERSQGRLNDNELRSPEASTGGKRRALEDSLQDVDRAIALDPSSWQAHDHRGFCESLLGRYPDAIETYNKALDLLEEQGSPAAGDRDGLLRRRAYAQAQAKQYAAAATDYVAAAGQDPGVCDLLWSMKEVAWEEGLYADAAVILDKLDQLLTANPDSLPPAVDPVTVATDRAWLLACGFGDDPEGRAVPVARQLLERIEQDLGRATDETVRLKLSLRRANALDTLAAAYARANSFAEATSTVDEAIAVAGKIDEALVAELMRHREKFEVQEPWNEP